MSAQSTAAPTACQLQPRAARPMLEFTAFSVPLDGAFVVGWPAAPGAVRRDAGDRPVLLHFAPARWLVPEPPPDIVALIEAATHAGAGTVVDVEGKWSEVDLVGPGAARLLASTIDVDEALSGRECAAVTLFDCPAVLARVAGGFAIWVRASYATDFTAAIERVRQHIG